MPNDKESLSVKFNRFANEFGNDVFSTNGQVLYCQVTQHVETGKHKSNLIKMKNKKQTLLSSDFFADSKNRKFNSDLVSALISHDISFWQI